MKLHIMIQHILQPSHFGLHKPELSYFVQTLNKVSGRFRYCYCTRVALNVPVAAGVIVLDEPNA